MPNTVQMRNELLPNFHPFQRKQQMANDVPANESEFVTFALGLLHDFFDQQGCCYRLRREVGVGRNIADVVALCTPTAVFSLPPESLTITESVVLSSLRLRGPTRIDLLERRCGARRGVLRNGALKRLRDSGAVTCGPGGRIALSAEWSRDYRLVAIEAKLTKWRDALKQAKEYRRYADEAYVLLPAGFANRARRAEDEFRDAGVGLWIIAGQKLTLSITAEKARDHCWRREFVFSRLVSEEPCSGRTHGESTQCSCDAA